MELYAIQRTPYGSYADSAEFSGDTDGSDNWQAICDEAEGYGNYPNWKTSGNYPAWEWVNAYAESNSLTGEYADGWYMPTIAEFCMLYRVKDKVDISLESAGGMKIYGRSYWSSSLSETVERSAWYAHFTDGFLYSSAVEQDDLSVCCIRAF